jgi:hypothetical protein
MANEHRTYKNGEREIAILKKKFRCNDPLGWKYTDKYERRREEAGVVGVLSQPNPYLGSNNETSCSCILAVADFPGIGR